MFETPTPFPTVDATPFFQVPDMNNEVVGGAIQTWNMLNTGNGALILTAFQALIIMGIVIGGIFLLLQVLNTDE